MKPSPLTLPAATSAFGMIIALLSLPLLALSFFIPNGFWLFATSLVMAGIGGGPLKEWLEANKARIVETTFKRS